MPKHKLIAEMRNVLTVLVGNTDVDSALLEWARQRNWPIRSAEKYVAPLEDVFVELVKAVPSAD